MKRTIDSIVPRYVFAALICALLIVQATNGQEQKTEEDKPAAAKKEKTSEKKPGDIQPYDEVITDDTGGGMFVCSDTDYCETRRAAGHKGKDAA